MRNDLVCLACMEVMDKNVNRLASSPKKSERDVQ
jgi:hypothetical protein